MKYGCVTLCILSLMIVGCGQSKPESSVDSGHDQREWDESSETAQGEQSEPETLVESGYDQNEMDQAIETARSKVDSFLTALSTPTGEDHAVKAPIKDDETVEHFWLIDVVYKDGSFTGTINNDPGLVSNVKFGQRWTLKKAEISDWMYMKDGKMHGNYTMRPLLKTLPDHEAAQYRSMLAEP